MANTTTTQVSAAVNNYFDRSLLKAARPLLLHTKWAQVRDIPRNNSLVIKFRRYSLLSANTTALSEGVTPSGSQLSVTDVTATVAQYGDFVTLTDIVEFSTLEPVLGETAQVLGQQAGNSLDQIVRDVMVAGTTVQYASTSTSRATVTASMKLTRQEIREAVRTLQSNDASKITTMVNPSDGFNSSPLAPCYVGIITENTLYDLKNEAGWIPVQEYASTKNLMEGEVGAMDDVRFVMTTNAKIFASAGSGSIDVHGTLILANDYYGITRIAGEALRNIIKPLGSAGSADPLDQRATSGWKATMVAARLNENFCVRIEHAVSV
ncbi:N4-gp56 family major capsid protein [Candidatus Roizmanbacteria bacterium]|nr:N4-gp56 family major capsid protein [Candidatus Roizmanbacteria bacterium]